MITFEKFKSYYEKYDRCMGDTYIRKYPLSENQLKNKYEKYIEKQNKNYEKAIIKQKEYNERYIEKQKERYEEKLQMYLNDELYLEDSIWKDVVSFVYKRDNYKCQLIEILTDDEYETLKRNAWNFIKILDPAHIFKVGSYPFIKYEAKYIVTLNRYSHSHLDSCKCPISGVMITQEEVDNWWKRIVGTNQYNILLEALKEY